jgi:phage gpG-like protein
MPNEFGFSVRITRDDFAPFAARMESSLSNLSHVLESVGLQVISLTKRAFTDASLRAAPWAPKRDGSPATLIQSGDLRQSIRITKIGATSVAVGSEWIYAAMQQLGGTIVPKNTRALVFQSGTTKVFAKKVTIPARPYFPITPEGDFTPTAREKIAQIIERSLEAGTVVQPIE